MSIEQHVSEQFPPEEVPDPDLSIAEIPLTDTEERPPVVDRTAFELPEKPRRNVSVPAGSKGVRIPITNPE